MALKRNMAGDEIINFIDNELLTQVKLEIGNWIHPRRRQGGYFVVTRQILCMIDFLGAVYSGYSRIEKIKDTKTQQERQKSLLPHFLNRKIFIINQQLITCMIFIDMV